MSEPIGVSILVGGQSSRMGRNKALVEVGGQPIIERIIKRVEKLGGELVLVTNTPELYARLGLPCIPDLYPGKGPLGGIYTALFHTQFSHTLVVSCDQPFLNTEFLQYLIRLRDGYDVIVPLDREGYPQGMQAIYGKGCMEAIRNRLDADRLKVIGFFPDVKVRELREDEIDAFDPERVSFMNVNTPDDLAEAERLARSGK